MPVVYLDLLFLLNLLINTATLYTTSLFLKKRPQLLRIFFAAVFLALYSVLVFFPKLSPIYSLIFKLLVLSVGVFIAFPSRSKRMILKSAFVFFSVNVIFAGTIYALIFATDFGIKTNALVSNGEIYLDISTADLLLAIIPAYILAYIFSISKKEMHNTASNLHKIRIFFENKSVLLPALADTGCHLKDPLFDRFGIVIEKEAAKKLLPADFFKALTCEPLKIPDLYLASYRALTYSSIGTSLGIMHGFVPNKLTIDDIVIKNCVVVISPNPLSRDNTFQGLFNPEIISSAVCDSSESFAEHL